MFAAHANAKVENKIKFLARANRHYRTQIYYFLDHWDLGRIFGFVFYPFVAILGIDKSEVQTAANLIGQKTFFTEFIAYQSLVEMSANRLEGLPRCDGHGNIKWISEKTEVVMTYALCGFSNLPATGIMLGCMISIAPKKKHAITKYVMLALFAGCVSCLIRACIASFLVSGKPLVFQKMFQQGT